MVLTSLISQFLLQKLLSRLLDTPRYREFTKSKKRNSFQTESFHAEISGSLEWPFSPETELGPLNFSENDKQCASSKL